LLRRAVIVVCVALTVPGGAGASELIDRDATNVKLEVSADGTALLTYRARGRTWHVLAWGAINAVPPTPSRAQVSFELDYAGGWGRYRKQVWKTFEDACRPYEGPKLAWLVTACKAPDGSYWALQSWRRMLPNVGLEPETALQAAWELRLSHWRGELPRLRIELDWAYRRYDHLYGSFHYRGQPVYGFRSTAQGAPLDTFGRNVYLDTFNSPYGPGWKRENSFLTHNPHGNFCYGVYPGQNNTSRPAGKGESYRATVSGPGVTPDVVWTGRAPGPYDAELDALANAEQRALAKASELCRPN
jgi:hypothetical protein